MIVLVAALLLLMRRVYLHHEATGTDDDASDMRSLAPVSWNIRLAPGPSQRHDRA